MINYNVRFVTCDETIDVKNSDVRSCKYETKKRSDESVFDHAKRDYYTRRGAHWRTPHPRHLKQLESKLRDKTIVKSTWIKENLVSLVFSSGAIAYLTVKIETIDVTHILFDRYFVGKLAGQSITNVALCKSHMLFVHNDRIATLVSFGKNTSTVPCRITDREPSLHSIELGGGFRRTERHLSSCDTPNGARILVWSVSAAEPAPWSPISAIEDLANLHLYQITGNNISLVAYHQLESETLCAEISHNQDNIIHVVEQIACQKNGVSIDWIRYDVPNASRATKLCSRESATRVSLPAPVRIARRSPCDARLLVACIDGSLHVVHQVAGLMRSVKAGFIATDIQWVDELIVAAEEGRIQCYDRALSLLHHHTKCFDLTSYTRDGRRMQLLCTQRARGGPVILASFSGGPLTLIRITHPRLLTSWIRSRRMSSAVALLRAMDWELEGTECLWAVNRIVCAALRSGSEAAAEEGAAQAALGAFLAPRAPHAAPALRFAPPVHDLARKFFHHLLRRGRIEKAMSLGVDLAAWDLFADARWAAEARHCRALAAEAALQARRLAHTHAPDSDCSDSCSDCSSSSYSNYDAETNVSSDITKTKPPPLPRVALLPTLLPVPISQPEPLSTNSIRPNLHQYLERDNTIWNTEIRNSHTSHDLKPILSTQSAKWHENGLPYKAPIKSVLINEPNKTVIDIIPRAHEASHFKHVFQTELREDQPNTLYRYQNYPTIKERTYRNENSTERQGNRMEKNKVKFSDTVTIAVVSQESRPSVQSETARELADSLPLCAPHKYLAAFAPHPSPSPAPAPAPGHTPAAPGTILDYVEV